MPNNSIFMSGFVLHTKTESGSTMNPIDPFAEVRRTRRQEKIRSSLGRLPELSIPTLERKVKSLKAKLHQLESEQLLAVTKDKEKLIEGKRALQQTEQKKARIKCIDEEIASILATQIAQAKHSAFRGCKHSGIRQCSQAITSISRVICCCG
jgi:hypothetical protein